MQQDLLIDNNCFKYSLVGWVVCILFCPISSVGLNYTYFAIILKNMSY